jgi:multidrug efflux pump subunit AcrA (membrane-fusion protein)
MNWLRTWWQQSVRWKKYAVVALVVCVFGGGVTLFSRDNEEVAVVTDPPRAVTLATIGSLGSVDEKTFVGTIAAVSQARLSTEASGRVTAVSVAAGDRVAAWSIIVQLENASERAALIQAEGAYEAARAAALQSDSGVRDAQTALANAQNNALAALRASYTSANGVLVSTIDPFFSSPQGAIPGLRVTGPATQLNTERVAFQTIMPTWQQAVTSATPGGDLSTLLAQSQADTKRLIAIIDTLVGITTTRDDELSGRPLESYTPGLLSARASLDGSVNALELAANGISAAREGLARAEVGGTNADISLANAQVKQAFGALEAARAAFNKTIVRSPISGTVNALQVKVGDNVGQGVAIAEIVNDSAYEVTFFVTEAERSALAIGSTVTVDGSATGTITSIAPALDPQTQKIEVRAALESTTRLSGSTAVVRRAPSSAAVNDTGTLMVPLTAVSFSIADGALLTVVDGTVVALPVTLGEISGSRVAVTGDVTTETVIIEDARGLIVGQTVTEIK